MSILKNPFDGLEPLQRKPRHLKLRELYELMPEIAARRLNFFVTAAPVGSRRSRNPKYELMVSIASCQYLLYHESSTPEDLKPVRLLFQQALIRASAINEAFRDKELRAQSAINQRKIA